jgi:hypothetical protein
MKATSQVVIEGSMFWPQNFYGKIIVTAKRGRRVVWPRRVLSGFKNITLRRCLYLDWNLSEAAGSDA